MMLILSVFCILFGLSTAQNFPQPCSIYDDDCQKQFYSTLRTNFAWKGLPQIGLSPADPLNLVTEKHNILGLWDLILRNGTAVGVKDCDLLYYKTNLKKRTRLMNIVCNKIVVNGLYQLVPSEAVKESSCFNYCADGHITITFHEWKFTIEHPFEFEKRAGKIYFKALFDKGIYLTDVKRVTTNATGIKFGNKDISEYANRWINQNWRLIMASSIGKRIYKRSEDYFDDIYEFIYARVPASFMFTDNLEPFVTK